ncbi:MAG: hypothetical protein GF329_09655 [Candidatus Lokiarchaeota archaeon]|nr:hypothetical protein [Candidatus Lokiarchaeota archaeon]
MFRNKLNYRNNKSVAIIILLLSMGILISIIFGINLYQPVINNTKGYKDQKNDLVEIQKNIIPTEIWNDSYSTTETDRGYDIILDGNYIYTVGDTYHSSLSDYNIIVLKHNKSGFQINYTTWNTSLFDFGKGIAVDSNHNIYVVGYTQGGGEEDILLIKFDSNLNQLWNKTYNFSNEEKGKDIVIDQNDNIYLVGNTYNQSLSQDVALVMKLDSNGDSIWNKSIYFNNNNHDGEEIELCGDFLYITGKAIQLVSSSYDIYLAKLDPDKNLIWNQSWGGSLSDQVYGLAVDESQNIYITGGSSSFSLSKDAFILKYNSLGNKIWNLTFGGADVDIGRDIIVDASNYIYIAGSSEDIDSKLIFNDPFIAKFYPNGSKLWNFTWKGFSQGSITAITLDSEVNMYFVSNIQISTDQDIYVYKYKVGTPPPTTTNPIPGFEITWLLVSFSIFIGFMAILSRKKLNLEFS